METDSGKRDPLIGATLNNRYQLEAVLGEGGMSTVYKARHLLLKRDVAIKIIREHLSMDQESCQRFQREAQATGALNHPNIVSIHEYCTSESGQLYMVMDYLAGQSLSDVLAERHRLSSEDALFIFQQICQALMHAHERGVVHRDLKPSNVMLLKSPDGGLQVKVVDLGLARFLPHSGKEMHRLTAAGELVGSPFYMSPEQIRDEPLDARSDIYSFGCLMYETLTGTCPFVDNNPIAILSMHLYDPPLPFLRVCPDSHIPKYLESIVFKAMEKDRLKRYQSVSDLLTDLTNQTLGAASEPEDFWAQLRDLPRPAELPMSAPAALSASTGRLKQPRQWQSTLHLQKPDLERKNRGIVPWLGKVAAPIIRKVLSEGEDAEVRKQIIIGTRVLVAALTDNAELMTQAEKDAEKYKVYYPKVDFRTRLSAQEFLVLLSMKTYDIVHLHGIYDSQAAFTDRTGFYLRLLDVKRACEFAKVKLLLLGSDNDLPSAHAHLAGKELSFDVVLTCDRGENFPKFLSSLLSRLSRGVPVERALVDVVSAGLEDQITSLPQCYFLSGGQNVVFLP